MVSLCIDITQTFRRQLMNVPHSFSPKIEENRLLSNSFYEERFPLITIQRQCRKRKLQTNIPHEYRCKIPSKIVVGHRVPWFQVRYKAVVVKMVWHGHKNRHTSIGQNREPQNKPKHTW